MYTYFRKFVSYSFCPLAPCSSSYKRAEFRVLMQMRRAKQEDKVQAVLTLRFAAADGFQQIQNLLKQGLL